ncbi:ribonuclease R [Roseivirga misakiensis]|uniref:Ribonuclease R n=1 Tax=Roseivirga misakiensis TaxID=1563681 RepID=A0A1E5T364_9BACT|nr:ribonuclease R [Roseivirga misakiensis]OEK05812.1 ribonuclease R [Roseivirga misakiensis]
MGRKRKSKPPHKASKGNPKKIEPVILNFLSQNSGRGYQIKQILKSVGVRDAKSKALVTEAIFRLEDKGAIKKLRNGAFTVDVDLSPIIATIDSVNPRFAYAVLANSEGSEDVWISANDLNGAMDDDKVKIVIKPGKHGKHQEGKVIEILERNREEFVGRLEMSTRYGFVIPDFKKMFHDVYVRYEDLNGAKHNDKVIVQITQWPDRNKKPEGVITRVLGKAGEHNAEIHSIIAEFGLPLEFPEGLEAEAETISDKISSKEIVKRKDFRKVPTFTIDPVDAKDFDDALSIKKLDNGNTEVGVHIADVTHYVQPETSLEKEAVERATSVYLVDRTIPMLPERLSNGLCSLRPEEEKLTFSAVFELDDAGEIQKEWFGRTIIYSDRRFAYEDAQERLENQEGDYFEEITALDVLAKKLRKKRFSNGAVNFETVEVKFKLDEKGTPLGVIPKERKDAHMLIEEFMLLANKRVAEFIYNKFKQANPLTFVYRSHDNPDPEKLDTFSNFARRFGHQMDFDKKGVSKSLNGLIENIEGTPEQNVLQQLAIRTMAKAKYTTEPKGHFGLAFPHYTHFTSPIRRYPDMMVHRLLQHYLDGGKSVDKEAYEELCVHASEREKRAADAERASIKYKQVEFMSLVEQKAFAGIVSGVTEWGVYVEITETKCEGMVRIADLDDDFYEYDEQNYRVIGRRNKRMISLGDEVFVRVKATDIDRRTIDLIFTEEDDE